MRTLFAAAIVLSLAGLMLAAPAAVARPNVPGVCTWGNDPCGPLDIVCVMNNGQVVACLTVTCTTQTQCTWPPQIHPCGDPCY